jgi:hypothetical protein
MSLPALCALNVAPGFSPASVGSGPPPAFRAGLRLTPKESLIRFPLSPALSLQRRLARSKDRRLVIARLES